MSILEWGRDSGGGYRLAVCLLISAVCSGGGLLFCVCWVSVMCVAVYERYDVYCRRCSFACKR